MTSQELLRGSFVALEVNDGFSEAKIQMQDQSRLVFCHRVEERWVRADRVGNGANAPSIAEIVLGGITMFRLNGKHLDIQFADASRWEAQFRGNPAAQ